MRGKFAIIFTVYNLRRAISILGVKDLLERFRDMLGILKYLIGRYFKLFLESIILKEINVAEIK